MEIDRNIIPIVSSNLLKYFIFSVAVVGSFSVPSSSRDYARSCQCIVNIHPTFDYLSTPTIK
jgi:hypothetical protein